MPFVKDKDGKWVDQDLMESLAKYPVVGPESLMDQKAHGTTPKPLMTPLRWGVDEKRADEVCCFNRHSAEHSQYFLETAWLDDVKDKGVTEYYDPCDGKPLFKAPIGRAFKEFLDESKDHGWPSFRDAEVNWDNVRCLENGECVSLCGTHLGHNLPDGNGNRYCINLVSCSGVAQDC